MTEQLKHSISLELATMPDIDDLLVIRNEALQAKLAVGDMAWESEPYTTDELSRQIERGYTHILRVGGEPAGSVDLVWEDEHNWGEKGLDGHAGYIHGLATSNAFRGQKLGERMIEWCASEALKHGRTAIRLDCLSSNDKLCSYYEKQGFVRVDVDDAGTAHYERSL